MYSYSVPFSMGEVGDVSGGLGGVLALRVEVAPAELCDCSIVDLIPHPVTGEDHPDVLVGDPLELPDFWDGSHSYRVGYSIPEGPTHHESRDVLFPLEHSDRSHKSP